MFLLVFLSRDTYGLWHWILFGRGTALPQYDCFCCHVWCCTQPLIGSVNLSKNNLLSFCCKSLFCSNHSVLRSGIGLSLCYYLHCSLHRFRHGCLLPPSFLASVSAPGASCCCVWGGGGGGGGALSPLITLPWSSISGPYPIARTAECCICHFFSQSHPPKKYKMKETIHEASQGWTHTFLPCCVVRLWKNKANETNALKHLHTKQRSLVSKKK